MSELADLKVSFIAGTLGQGGAERQLFYIMQALRQAGAEARLLCLTQGEFWEEKLRELGVPIAWVGQHGSRLARLLSILRELRKHPPDLVQSQHFYTNLYAAGAARALGLREIGAIRSDGVFERQHTGALVGQLCLRAPRTLAVNSRAGIHGASSSGVSASRLKLLPNVVDSERFKPVPRPVRTTARLIAVGRLGPEKRLDRLLAIVADLRQFQPELRAIVVGDGPLKSQLERQAMDLGLLPTLVEFRGGVADTAPVYREGDILVLTSDTEGTPNVVLEAMASGLPVVATRVGGVPEIVQHGETGYLCDPEDTQAMTSALRELIGDAPRRQRMGDAAREYVLTSHSVQRLPEILAGFYRAVLA